MALKLLLGTRNLGKVQEIRTILGEVPMNLCSLKDFPEVRVAPEDENTYSANAISKARFYAAATGLVALADDSGLEVESLDGRPGVFSARYAGDEASDADRRALLLSEVEGKPGREARFVCSVAIATPDGRILGLFEGVCTGKLTEVERGNAGFGYDPIFMPDGFDKTFGELSEEVKNRISHRAKALEHARHFLNSEATHIEATKSL